MENDIVEPVRVRKMEYPATCRELQECVRTKWLTSY
jgi:hypothetical protein